MFIVLLAIDITVLKHCQYLILNLNIEQA